ncbi:MAG: hypothetical protein K2K94_09180 [Muribaculaceae bacterium]|nr:hypothetical protein [Muribaculaceae bacterium]
MESEDWRSVGCLSAGDGLFPVDLSQFLQIIRTAAGHDGKGKGFQRDAILATVRKWLVVVHQPQIFLVGCHSEPMPGDAVIFGRFLIFGHIHEYALYTA